MNIKKTPNFVYNRYIYVAIAGAVEAVSYVVPIPMLRWTGRRTTSVVLYVVSGVALLSIISIPEGELGETCPWFPNFSTTVDEGKFTC
jgi:hypothetical protein